MASAAENNPAPASPAIGLNEASGDLFPAEGSDATLPVPALETASVAAAASPPPTISNSSNDASRGDGAHQIAPRGDEASDDEVMAAVGQPVQDDIANVVGRALSELNKKIDREIVSSRHHEKIIDNLHAELQHYKGGHLRQLLTPILTDLVRLYDDLSTAVSNLPQKQGITIEQAVQSMSTFPSDVSYILERQGLETFAALPGERFDPSRQRALKRQPTDDVAADKTVAQSLRPGFLWEGKVFRPNFVTVYVYSAATPSESTEAATM